MSNVGLSMQENSAEEPQEPRRPKRKRGRSGFVIFISLVVVLGLGAAVAYGAFLVIDRLEESAPVADYPGPGNDEVVITVEQGETLTDIGGTLYQDGVVASVQAFTDAALLEEEATGVTPGRYLMLTEMSGAGAVERLLDPASRNENNITIPEGLRTDQTVALLAKATGKKKKNFDAVIQTPGALPLPEWAEGTGEARVEGFLFPATYEFDKNASPEEMLTVMVEKFNAVADDLDFEVRAAQTGYSAFEVLTVASLAQAEAPPDDFGKVARVVYNRIEPETWGETYGYLGFDSTVNYALKKSDINPSGPDREINSPYNTFTEQHQGLTPTPINSPGEAAMEAALEAPDGDWLYFVTTNPDTGKTKFTNDYGEFLGYKEEFQTWYREQQ
ncbi:MAG: aminodeoxychorismate lyase [Micrococcales bacterium]|nr:aminodeoxychorismate lyase [Micrococcales bacterium]